MLIKLHGTSGSGKSTVARDLLNRGSVTILDHAYAVTIEEFNKPLYVLGLYNSQCGGCDTLTAGQQIEMIHFYAPKGHVFYEGLLGSEYYGKLGAASEPYGKNHVFAFLDTPVDLCIDRVKARRLAVGNTRPFNEINTRSRVRKINALKFKLHLSQRNVVDISHMNAGQQVFDLYRNVNAQSETTG